MIPELRRAAARRQCLRETLPLSPQVIENPTPFATSMLNFFKKIFRLRASAKEKPKNLKEVLGRLKKTEEDLKVVRKDLASLKEKNRNNLQKVGVVRYNPFAEVGGDQSFSIALLDENDNGVVITSHYFRDSNRVYAKPVENGTSKYSLSGEEKEAITRARGS